MKYLFYVLACEYVAKKIHRLFSRQESVKAEEIHESSYYTKLEKNGEPEFTDLNACSMQNNGATDKSVTAPCENPKYGCQR